MTERIIIGLTGGMASGKSTVAQLLASQGARIIECDALAKEILNDHHDIRQAIGERWSLNPDDRPALRQLIASSPEAKAWLEAKLHPRIRQAVHQRLEQPTDAPFDVVVVPLLVETQAWNHYPLTQVVVVDAHPDQQRKRAKLRDGPNSQAHALIAQQTNRMERLAHADVVLDNTQGLAHLTKQVAELHQNVVGYSQNRES